LDIRANDSSDCDDENEIEGSEDVSANVSNEHTVENGLSTGKDGNATKNIFNPNADLTIYCPAVSTPLAALRLLIDDGMLCCIKTCT